MVSVSKSDGVHGNLDRTMTTYRMPLPTGDVGYLDEEPLAGNVLEAGLDDAELHGAYSSDQHYDFRK